MKERGNGKEARIKNLKGRRWDDSFEYTEGLIIGRLYLLFFYLFLSKDESYNSFNQLLLFI